MLRWWVQEVSVTVAVYPGDTTEVFNHNTIDCGLQEKPAQRCNEHLPCQTMLKYAQVTLFSACLCF